MNAIVYCSQTGHTARYAKLLAQRLELPACELEDAAVSVPRGGEIVFLSWLRAGAPRGWKKASGLWRVAALGVVGMSAGGAGQLPAVAKHCGLGAEFPLFYLPGGYDREKVRGVDRLLMKAMAKSVVKSLSAKPRLTAEEQALLQLWQEGGDLVDAKHLAALAAWCQKH